MGRCRTVRIATGARARCCGLVAALLVPAPTALAAERRPVAGCGAETAAEVVAAVTDEGAVRLASGRFVKLAGLRLPEDGPPRAAALDILRRAVGQNVTATAVLPPDRWARVPVRLARPGSGAPVDAAESLVEAGLAVVDAGERSLLCHPELLAVEATARERGLGVWADGRYKPVASDDAAGLRERTGRFALAEGRVRSVGERRSRTYLNFGVEWNRALTVTIPKRTWAIMVAKGLSASRLKGRLLRVRGIVEEWRGPVIEITSPDMVEVLDREPARH